MVEEHATDGKKALRIDHGFAAMDGPQSWAGYDYLKADVYTDAKDPMELSVEVGDRETRDYWTRVNYNTVVPPGASTLIIPTSLYVGEKSRPGRLADEGRRHAARLHPSATSRRRRSTSTTFAWSATPKRRRSSSTACTPSTSAPPAAPVMEGFTPLDPGKTYSKGRGYGWKDAHFWRAFDVLQPDPLYQISSASSRVAWPSTCPTASTTSSSTWTRRPDSGASSSATASGP